MPKEKEIHDNWLELVTNKDRTNAQVQSRVRELVGKYGAEKAVFYPNFNFTGNQTPLMLASYNGRADVAHALIDERADVNFVSGDKTPIYLASSEGHLHIIQLLVARRAEVNKLGVLACPIQLAAKNGHGDVVQYLHEHEADINQPGYENRTALWVAASKGHLEVVKYLCENGAAINAQDLDQKTPIYEAAYKSHINVVEYLVANKADINIRAEDFFSAKPHDPFISILGKMVREVRGYSAPHDDQSQQKIQFCKDIIKALLLSTEYPLHISSESEEALIIDVLQESPFLITYKEPALKNREGQFYSDPKISGQISANKSYIETVFSSLYSAIKDNNLFSIIFGYLIEGNSQLALQSLSAFIKSFSLEEATKQTIAHKAKTEEAVIEDNVEDNANATAGISSSVLIEEIFAGKSSAEEAPEDLGLSGNVFHHSEE